jgi:hypothetical protein
MTGLIRWMLSVACLCMAASAHAETVTGQKVNCRAAARVTSRVLGTLRRGDDVSVISSDSAWSYVDPARLSACYVRSDLLAASPGGYAGYSSAQTSRGAAKPVGSSYRQSPGLFSTSRYTSRVKRRPASTRRSSRSRGFYDGGGSCPCSGSNICVGPRGGRYCITSGGNKRYGV